MYHIFIIYIFTVNILIFILYFLGILLKNVFIEMKL
jgi:hypothetical protein